MEGKWVQSIHGKLLLYIIALTVSVCAYCTGKNKKGKGFSKVFNLLKDHQQGFAGGVSAD